ncbi:MAG: 2-oxoacid:acceptor oxidoreductase family protein [Acidimicrobiia bacterium]
MQRELMLTGIGGQGIQLAAKTIALAAVAEGRQAMLLGSYAGAMRGGQTDASVVFADQRLKALPKLPSAWSAIVMHPDYWPMTRERIRPNGVVVVNATTVDDVGRDDLTVFRFRAGDLSQEMGAPMAASYILLGAYATITGLVTVDALVEAMKETVPPYRTQHLANNEAALRKGGEIAESLSAPAWVETVGAGGQ